MASYDTASVHPPITRPSVAKAGGAPHSPLLTNQDEPWSNCRICHGGIREQSALLDRWQKEGQTDVVGSPDSVRKAAVRKSRKIAFGWRAARTSPKHAVNSPLERRRDLSLDGGSMEYPGEILCLSDLLKRLTRTVLARASRRNTIR